MLNIVSLRPAWCGCTAIAVSLDPCQSPTPDWLSVVSGRIEGDLVVVAAKVSGRVVALHVSEGDAGELGRPIADIGAKQIRACALYSHRWLVHQY